MPPASGSFHLGHAYTLKESKPITDGDFQFQVNVPIFDADVPTFHAYSKDEGFLLGLIENRMEAHEPISHASMDGCGREQQGMNACVPIIDPLADGGITYREEQEIVDANVPFTDNSSPPQSPPPKLNPEFAGFSSVQDWVNSIEQECFLDCPTPLVGATVGGNLQAPAVDWEIYEEAHGGDMFSLPVPGSPLHEHLGYKSPSELFNKTIPSDDEIKMPSDTTSSASTSATSTNTFMPPGFESVDRSKDKSGCKTVFLKQVPKNSLEGNVDVELSDAALLSKLFRRGFKGLVQGKNLSVTNAKSRVTVNGHVLSQQALKRAEDQAGKLRPGTYWYDSKAGFWGIIGGPCLGVLPPFIEELQYPMSRDCSNGDTQIFVNGRELHQKDLMVLVGRGFSKKPGMSYAIGFDGIVIEEASGQELNCLGKLAPSVERKGQGFGMYTAKQS